MFRSLMLWSLFVVSFACPTVAVGDIITQWNFNGGTGTSSPNVGSGTASLVGGTTATFASGTASGGSSDLTTTENFGWNVTNWPASGNNETAGVQFNVSTVGFQDIVVSWDQRHSNSASRFFAFQYTTDGSTWTRLNVGAANASPGTTPSGGNPASTSGLFGGNGTFSAFDGTVTGAGDDWFNGRSVSLSAIAGVNNNPNFGFRILSSFGDGTGYVSSSANPYAATGTARFDMVTVTSVPEPASISFIAIGCAAFVGSRLRRKRLHWRTPRLLLLD